MQDKKEIILIQDILASARNVAGTLPLSGSRIVLFNAIYTALAIAEKILSDENETKRG